MREETFKPETPQQVYAMYTIRLAYYQYRLRQHESDSFDDRQWSLIFNEAIRRLSLSHDIYKQRIGSEMPQ